MTLGVTRSLSLVIPMPDKAKLARIWMWTQVMVVIILVCVGLLTLGSLRGVALVLGLVWIVCTTNWKKSNRRQLGLVYKDLAINRWILEGAIVIALIIWVIGMVLGPARHINYMPDQLIEGKLGYFIKAALQQAIIQSYCFTRLEELVGCPRRACKWTAALFAFCHIPNPLLMAISWTGGRVSCALFHRYRNLLTLAAAHGIIGASLAAFWSPWVIRAGIGFVRLLLGSK